MLHAHTGWCTRHRTRVAFTSWHFVVGIWRRLTAGRASAFGFEKHETAVHREYTTQERERHTRHRARQARATNAYPANMSQSNCLHRRARDTWLDDTAAAAVSIGMHDALTRYHSYTCNRSSFLNAPDTRSKQREEQEPSRANSASTDCANTAVNLSLRYLFPHPGGAALMTISQCSSACPRRFGLPPRLAPVVWSMKHKVVVCLTLLSKKNTLSLV